MKNVLIIIGVIIGVFVLYFAGLGFKILLFPVHTVGQSVDTAYGIVDKTLDADNAIYNYEWFKEQEALIRQNLKNEELAKEEWENFKSSLPEDREKWTREDKQEEASLRNSYYALQKLTNKSIEDYNARAEMVNRNIFKDNLPVNISRAFYTSIDLIND